MERTTHFATQLAIAVVAGITLVVLLLATATARADAGAPGAAWSAGTGVAGEAAGSGVAGVAGGGAGGSGAGGGVAGAGVAGVEVAGGAGVAGGVAGGAGVEGTGSGVAGGVTNLRAMPAVEPHPSQPLRDLASASSEVEEFSSKSAIIEERLSSAELQPLESDSPDLLLTSSANSTMAAATAPALDGSFAGMTFGAPSQVSNPPDTVGDIGPNHYVQMVNMAIAAWDKTGAALMGPVAINSLWSGTGGLCESNSGGDPIVLYDQLADRWLVSQLAVDSAPYAECIAISQTPDPTGTYHLYEFDGLTDFPDYPKLAVWSDAYYMSTQPGGFTSSNIYAFERAAMLTGAPAQWFVGGPIGPATFLLPSDLEGPAPPPNGTPNFFTTMENTTGSPSTPGSCLVGTACIAVYDFSVDWAAPNASFDWTADVPIADFTYTVCGFLVVNCISQPAPGVGLAAISEQPMWRTTYRNFGNQETLLGNFTVNVGANQAGIRWWELRNTGSGWALKQEGTVAPDAEHRWIGSVAMDQTGDIALGYSVSSSVTRPSIRYTTHQIGDSLGTMRAEVNMMTGLGVQTAGGGNRWGDYSSMNVDPTDDCTFWYTNEYYKTDSALNWGTRIGWFKVPTCGPVTLAISKDANVAVAKPGDQVTFTITYANTGTGTASGVEIIEAVPVGTTFVGPSGWAGCSPGALAGTVCTYDVGIVQGGGSGTLMFVVQIGNDVSEPFTITNTVTITGDYAAAAHGWTPASREVMVMAPADSGSAAVSAAAVLPFTGGSVATLFRLALFLLTFGLAILRFGRGPVLARDWR